MDIVLYYRGELHANGGPEEKHRIRQAFSRQLRRRWSMPLLSSYHGAAIRPESPVADRPTGNTSDLQRLIEASTFPSLIKVVGGSHFLPLVCQQMFAVAEIDLTLLRPEPPGNIVTQGGDIDNRIKTLLDSLKVPDANQVRPEMIATREAPTYCLLEDDNLITRMAVRTEYLLEEVAKNEVILLLHVTVRRTMETITNSVIA